MEPTGGTFTIGTPHLVITPANWAAKALAWLFPGCWARLVPARWRRTMTVRMEGWQSEPIPYDADASRVQQILSKRWGEQVAVERVGLGEYTVTFSGQEVQPGAVDEDPAQLLARLRGRGNICACGKELEPVRDANGKQLGMTHKTVEDEDYHLWYFTGMGLNPATNDYEDGFNPYGQPSLPDELGDGGSG